MTGIDPSSTVPGTPTGQGMGLPEPLEALAVPVATRAVPGPAAAGAICRPTVRIARRSKVSPWRNPRRLDPAIIGSRLIIEKARGLFLRECQMRFNGDAAKAKRAAEARPKARKPRRWEPVVISPVFPRGPLELPSLGFLHERRRRSVKTCRGRPVRPNRSRRPDQVA
jgi:hypothetical protein